MPDTPEGIGALKFSLIREGPIVKLMRGSTLIATLAPGADDYLHLLVSSPQLWTAANDILVASDSIKDYEHQPEVVKRLGNAVAKSVDKGNWREVLQP